MSELQLTINPLKSSTYVEVITNSVAFPVQFQ
jgi:hypothetical protein